MQATAVSATQARIERWRTFMEGASSGRFLWMIRYSPDDQPRPLPWADNVPQRIEWAWDKYQRQIRRMQWLDDDTLPYLDCYSGTEVFAEAFGCPVNYPSDNMPHALPLISSASEVAKLKVPSLDCPCIKRLFDIGDELVRRAGNNALVRIPDIQSPMDIAALIWDKNDFYMALVESPQAVRELAEKTGELLVAFVDQWLSRYGRSFIAHYPDYYMPRGITLSEDEIGVVSEEMFAELFLPELSRLSQRYGGIGIHCCADSHHHWPMFKQIPGLKLLNLVQPARRLEQAFTGFASVAVQMHSWQGQGEPWTWPSQVPSGTRVIFEMPASSREEALDIAFHLQDQRS